MPKDVQNAQANSPESYCTANPQTGSAPLTVTFDGTRSTAAHGKLTIWSWKFGDSIQGQGSKVSHTYANPGIYSAILSVTDDSAHMSIVDAECTITVTH